MNGRRTLRAVTSTYRPQEKEFANVESVAEHYEQIMERLKRLVTDGKLKSYHSVDAVRFHKLIEWVAFKEHNLKMVEEAWSSSYFWPFLETMEAARLVQNDPSQLVIRLSNTHSGTITITRLGKKTYGVGEHRRFEEQVRHKRCVINHDGTLTLINEDNNQQVSWEELVHYLLTRECCICLEEITSTDMATLPCKHCFHKTCLRGYLFYNQQQGKEDQCVSCRLPFRKMQWSETINPKSLSAISMSSSKQLLSTDILTTELFSTVPYHDSDKQSHNSDKFEQEPISQSAIQFQSGDNSQTALCLTPKCYVPSTTQALQGFENNCDQSQLLRLKLCSSPQTSLIVSQAQQHESIVVLPNAENNESYPRNNNYKKANVSYKSSVVIVVDSNACDESEKKRYFKDMDYNPLNKNNNSNKEKKKKNNNGMK